MGTKDVSAMLGVSPRNLQWWDETGLVSPEQRGHRRYYSRTNVLLVGIVVELRKKKVSLQKTRSILRFLVRSGTIDQLSSAKPLYILANDKTIFVSDSSDDVCSELVKSDSGWTAILLDRRFFKRLGLA